MRTEKAIKELPWRRYSGISTCKFQISGMRKNTRDGRVYVFDFICNTDGNTHEHFEDFRLVISKKRKDYTVIRQSKKRGSMPRLRDCLKQNWCGVGVFSYFDADESTLKMMEEITGCADKDSSNHGLPELADKLDEFKERAKEAREKASGRIEDDAVYDCPQELPQGFVQWIRNNVLPQDNTLIYKRGNRRGICHVCGRKVTGRFLQNTFVSCPYCGTRVRCVLENSQQWKAEHVGNVIFAQKGADGKTVWFRQIRLERDPNAAYEQTENFLKETARYAVRGDKAAMWQKYKHENRLWNPYEYSLPDWERSAKLMIYDGMYQFCEIGLEEAISGTKLQYACLSEYLRDEDMKRVDVVKYALDFVRFPVLEFLYKRGYKRIVASKVCGYMRKDCKYAIRWQRKEIKECFKFPLRYLKLMKPAEWTIECVERVNRLSKDLNFDETKQALDLGLNAGDIGEILRFVRLSKLVSYLNRQDGESSISEKVGIYRDYLRECVALNYDMKDKSILFPKSLYRAHERTMQLMDYEKNREVYDAFGKRVKKLKKLAFSEGGLMVKVPSEAAELKQEGQRLHHCVGGYIGNMAAGKTVILFIRRTEKPDEPFYTLEYRDGEIVQCRTKNNASYKENPEVLEFTGKWLKHIKEQERKGIKDGRNRKTA